MMTYNNPIIKMLETLGNMLIVSIYWIVCSFPIVTIVPASAALYHTCVKVIFGEEKGKGLTKCFFKSYVSSLRLGWILSIFVIIATFFVIVGINTGLQIYKLNVFGTLYLVLGILICLTMYPAILYIPVVLSRFEGDLSMVLRMSLYFASGNIRMNIKFAILLGVMVFAVGLFPLFLLVVPALYVDLIRLQMEGKLLELIKLYGLEEEVEESLSEEEFKVQSITELEKSLNVRGKRNK